MLTIPDPEHAEGGETEVEITDLDSGKVSARSTRQNRVRAWMSLAMIAGTALLVVAILVSVSHLPKAATVTVPPVRVNYPVSLSVVDGICYTTAPNGVVTALRVSDGSLLWRHAGGKTGEESTIVVDGVVYLAPLLPSGSNDPTVTIEALRASDGSPLWSHTLPMDSPTSFQFTVGNSDVYVISEVERIDALRASDGSLLWHYTSHTPFVSLPAVSDGVVYTSTQDGHFSALSASDGIVLWTYTSLNLPQLPPAVVAEGMVFLSFQDGSMDVLRASTGILLWRYTPRLPALQLFPLILVADGVVYAGTQDGRLYALRASDGFTIWSVVLHANENLILMNVAGGVVFVAASFSNSVYALHESSGSVIWQYTGSSGGSVPIMVVQGVVYLALTTAGANTFANITTLRASDGILLWNYTPPTSYRQLLPVVGNDIVLIALQDGSVEALGASSGSLLWRRVMNS